MNKILLISTGGTIASKDTGHGLKPSISSEQLAEFVPETKDICLFDTMQLFALDSTNISPYHWIKIASTIKDNYDNYDGFIITHGTDTLSYTAAALSYMIQNSPKPIILTGSQKSIYLRDTDARRNLIDAFLYANHPHAQGVRIVFNGNVILGTRARKTKTHSYNAFDSIDYPAIAKLSHNRIIPYISFKKPKGSPTFSLKMDPSVFVLKLIPGMSGDIIDKIGPLYRALIVESFGAGGLPNMDADSLLNAAYRYSRSGRLLIMTTQVPYEGSALDTYEVGYNLKNSPNILEGGNMTMEALTCKLMWVLAHSDNPEEIKKMLYNPIEKDIL